VKRASFQDMNCSVARSLEVVGEWWTLLILRDCFFGITRFEDFHERLGIARNVLATRLDALVGHGVLHRVPYDEARGRYDYRLTDMGRALWPVLTMLRQWGDEWILGQDHAPIELVHDPCGRPTRAELACDHCGERLAASAVRPVPGPGYRSEDELLLEV
jgi:DNA-binding HxlR family transcriptional regulator